MGFDLFMAVVAIVLAVFLTWLTIWWYLAVDHRTQAFNGASHSNTDAESGAVTRARPNDAKPLIVAATLSAPVLLADLMHMVIPSALPSWAHNPWLQVILITPVIFYCGMPIAIEGWEAFKRHAPDMNTLTAIGAAAAYFYSLALCIAGGVLPNDPNAPYFGFAGLAVTLALFGRYLEIQATVATGAGTGTDSRGMLPQDNWNPGPAPAPVRRYYHLILWCVPITMIVATWAFALSIVFGYQPRLAHAIVAAFCVLMIVGLTLAAIKTGIAWKLLRRHTHERAQSPKVD